MSDKLFLKWNKSFDYATWWGNLFHIQTIEGEKEFLYESTLVVG